MSQFFIDYVESNSKILTRPLIHTHTFRFQTNQESSEFISHSTATWLTKTTRSGNQAVMPTQLDIVGLKIARKD